MLVYVGSFVFDDIEPLNLVSPVLLIILLFILKIRFLFVALTLWVILGLVRRSCLVTLVKTLTLRTILKRGESISVIRALT